MRGYAWLASALAGLLVLFHPGPVDRVDGPALDAAWRLLRRLHPATPQGSSGVTVLALDGNLLAAERLPLGALQGPLGDALVRVSQARPRAVVLDLVLPQDASPLLADGAEARLVAGLIAVRARAPLIALAGVDDQGRVLVPHAPLLAALGGEHSLALGWLPRDGDGVVRRLDPGLAGDAAPLRTLESLLGERLGIADLQAPGWIDFATGRVIAVRSLQQVLEGPAGKAIAPAAAPALPAPGAGPSGAPAMRVPDLEGRIVLVGAILPEEDRVRLPLDPVGGGVGEAVPGVLAHAQAIASALDGGLVQELPRPAGALALLVAAAPALLRSRRTRAAWALATLLVLALACLALLARGWWLAPSAPLVAITLALLLAGAIDLAAGRRSERRLLGAFEGYVSPAVLAGKLGDGLPAVLAAPAAVLFVDLRGYSAWTEGNPPAHVLAHTSRWHEAAGRVVRSHGGTVDHLRGDGMLVLFGAPVALAGACGAAWQCAQDLLDLARGFRLPAAAGGGPALEPPRLAMGLAWGEVAAGEVGGRERRDYTALGDVVNVAARLQEHARALDQPLVATARFCRELERERVSDGDPPGPGRRLPGLVLQPLGRVALRGHSPVEAVAASWTVEACGDRRADAASAGQP